MDGWLLTLITFLPAAAGLALALVKHEGLVRKAALLVSLVVLGMSIVLWTQYDPAKAGLQLGQAFPWIPALNIRYAVGVINFMPINPPDPTCEERARIVRWIDADAP